MSKVLMNNLERPRSGCQFNQQGKIREINIGKRTEEEKNMIKECEE